jgi:hypothetical protein
VTNYRRTAELKVLRIESNTPCTQDPELWFEEKNVSRNKAKRMCRTLCDVQETCLRNGLVPTTSEKAQHPLLPFGIWGGYDRDERVQIAASMKAAASAEAEPQKRVS